MFMPLAVLSAWVLLAAPLAPSTEPPLPACATGPRHIELDADAPISAPEVCIRPGLILSFLFDVKLARVEIEGRERFLRVEEGTTLLSLVPSEALHDGERVPVTVHFQSEATPSHVTFTLVVHPSQAERQVEVSRRERTVDSYRRGEQLARGELSQCQAEKARLELESKGPGGLSALILQGQLSKRGIIARTSMEVNQRPSLVLDAKSYTGYRAVGSPGRGRIVLEVVFLNQGALPWTPTGAALLPTGSERAFDLKPWPQTPIAPGKFGRIVVEMDAAEHEAHGPFTFKVWDAEGRDGAVLDGVSFP